MTVLIIVTLLWAFSFSLIGEYLAGSVDAYAAVAIRMGLASLLFLPILLVTFRRQQLAFKKYIPHKLMLIGAIQIGVMYILLYHAFLYLSVAEVLLFTIFTPLYISLLDEFVLNRKALPWKWWIAALLSVIGAAVIRYQDLSEGFLLGFLLIQGANFAFALGQVAYKRLELGSASNQISLYGWFFIGAWFISSVAFLLLGNRELLPSSKLHWWVLIWLGIVASGVGYIAWSIASKKVNIGQLATMNNALIPAGLIVNFAIWERSVAWLPLLIGGSIILFSVWLCRRA